MCSIRVTTPPPRDAAQPGWILCCSKLGRLAAQLCALDAALVVASKASERPPAPVSCQLLCTAIAAVTMCANMACWLQLAGTLGRNDAYRVATAARLVLHTGTAALRAALFERDRALQGLGTPLTDATLKELTRSQVHAMSWCLMLLGEQPKAAAAWAASVAPPGLLLNWLESVTVALQRQGLAKVPGGCGELPAASAADLLPAMDPAIQ